MSCLARDWLSRAKSENPIIAGVASFYLSAVNMEAAAHCQINPDEVAEALRDLTATVSEAAPVLMMKAVDLAVECEKARGKS